MLNNKTITDFQFGIIDTLEPKSLPRGAASASLNWLTQVDRIALRNGYKLYGNDTSGIGKITGLFFAKKSDGTELKFRTHGQVLEYYVTATDTWTEIGTNILGAGADGKDMSFAEWHPIAGDYVYVNSPYGPFIKIDLANPTAASSVYNVAKNYYGYIKIKQNRMWLWGRTADKTGVYISKISDPEDFTYSATRVAGEGNIFRQDDGGPVQTIESYGDEEYCIHTDKTWVITITVDDTNATNVIYRERVGISSFRGAVPTANGIYYIDDSDKANPQIRLLTIPYGMDKVIPVSISKARAYKNKKVGIDLSGYYFDKACGIEYEDYIVFSIRTLVSTQNNTFLLYNKTQGSFDLLNYWASCLAVSSGDLLGGDPVENNVIQFFSNYSDESADITNYWEGNKDDLDWSGEKKLKRLIIKGKIGIEQSIKISVYLDDATAIELGTISGSSSSVTGAGIAVVGRTTIGRHEIGGGGSGTDYAEFISEINVANLIGKFNDLKLRIEATDLGVAEISEIIYKDYRIKSQKLISRFR